MSYSQIDELSVKGEVVAIFWMEVNVLLSWFRFVCCACY
jgi:hypothetical protein